ncbi:MAG TPA: protein kinase, partial [Pyrinomonadaceae bacterium]|nr:protein kinase [Pyrinomonadaceae bacterium]
DLKAEVEKLIESHEQAEDDDFIGGLAVEDVAEHFTGDEEELALQKGQQFGDYLILDHLGTGGMGQVYLARDARLDRTVALKILSSDVAADERRMQRFRQEAKVTSSLNQPNILTIFESGEVDGLTFIAAEFVDGETLRDYLRGKRLKLGEILDIGIQVLAALDAAHEAKIVHRDMKPDNVMIRKRDHVVKVLDFGLAKVTHRKKSTPDDGISREEAVTDFKTAPGQIMGTVNYMSPEQTQAKAVDARSDIWSTGVIVYEMVAGTKPFGGTTSAHTIVQILEKDPAPLAHAGAPGVPEELQRIVAKSIAKDPDERYQTAKDMLIDLRNLKKRLELDAEIERSAAFALNTSENAKPVRTAEPAIVETTQRANYSVVIALIAIGAVVAAIIGFNTWRAVRNRSAAQPVTSATTAPEARLTYWITVQKFKDGKPYQDPFDLAAEINFEADYQIRLSVRSPQAGYLYVLNEGPSTIGSGPEYVVIFPSPTANNGSEFIPANQQVQIPNETWLRFDKEQGVEKLWLVFSDQPISELAGVKAFATARTRGLINDPRQNKTITSFLRSYPVNSVIPEKGETLTTLKAASKTVVYPIRLEHH